MRTALMILALITGFTLSVGKALKPMQPLKDKHILVFTKTTGWRHDSIPAAVQAFKKAAGDYGFTMVHSEESALFTPKSLDRFDAVVFLLTTGDVLNDQQQAALKGYMQAGHGFVGVHSASDTECHADHRWPWFLKMVGGCFMAHPNDPNVRQADLTVINRNHISTKDMPMTFRRADEWYDFSDFNKAVTVLVTVDEDSYGDAKMGMGKNHPISWYQAYDGGRMFYTAMGHTIASYSDPLFLDHLFKGLTYAVGE